MKRKNFLLFLTAYFLLVFLWLFFCFRQVQKACEKAGHRESSVLEITVPEEKGRVWEEEKNRQEFWEGLWEKSVVKKERQEEEKRKQSGIEGESKEENGEDGERAGRDEEEGKENGAGSNENKTGDTEKKDMEETEDKGKADEGCTEMIRVVLTGSEGIYHDKVVLQAGEECLEIEPESSYFDKTNVIRVSIAGNRNIKMIVANLEKACGHPSYEGVLEIRQEEGRLVLINEVSLETYVKGVLPSEMPSSYPPEALKAQAVCARTYAKMKQEAPVYPQYDAAVDDTTACQVYGNIERSGEGDQAVEDTAGIVILDENRQYMECYYYSTSCGRSAEVSVWHGGETEVPVLQKSEEEISQMNQDFFAFIREKDKNDIEYTESFYRWNYRCEKADTDKIYRKCRGRQEIKENLVHGMDTEGENIEITKKKLGAIREMDIAERKEGGVADCLRISCEKGMVYVWGEYNIRYVLAQGGSVVRRDDTDFQINDLLPSAFLSLQSICNDKGNMVGYIVVGGGFGHGVGLSQNGAKQMALNGKNYLEILEAYYSGTVNVKKI